VGRLGLAKTSCGWGNADHLTPCLEGVGAGGSISARGQAMAAELDVIVDLAVGGEETVGVARRLEPLHLPLASPMRMNT